MLLIFWFVLTSMIQHIVYGESDWKECRVDDDCGKHQYCFANHFCRDKVDLFGSCWGLTASPCKDGLQCENSYCKDYKSCRINYHCDHKSRCEISYEKGGRSCVKKGGSGDECTSHTHCGWEYYCEEMKGKCYRRREFGEKCRISEQCHERHNYCVKRINATKEYGKGLYEKNVYQCLLKKGRGGDCENDEECFLDDSCQNKICHDRLLEGSQCEKDRDCIDELACIYDSNNSSTSHCSVQKYAGESCRIHDEDMGRNPFAECRDGLLCINNICAGSFGNKSKCNDKGQCGKDEWCNLKGEVCEDAVDLFGRCREDVNCKGELHCNKNSYCVNGKLCANIRHCNDTSQCSKYGQCMEVDFKDERRKCLFLQNYGTHEDKKKYNYYEECLRGKECLYWVNNRTEFDREGKYEGMPKCGQRYKIVNNTLIPDS